MKIAALTMIYNEPVWAPIWARHYAAELGPAHCYIIDHGTDDNSTATLPPSLNIERIPRTPLDETWRAAFISNRAEHLLRTYDAVIHTDADELLVADPAAFPNLTTMIAATAAPVLTAIGLDLQHRPALEPGLDLTKPIAEQRQWLRFAASMCKPAIIRRPVRWSPGFHSADAPLVFGHAALLHMRYADLNLALTRLHRTRNQAFATPDTDTHQRTTDAEFTQMVQTIATLPTVTGPLAPLVAPWLQKVTASRRSREQDLYKLDLTLAGDTLWDGHPLLRQIR